MGGWVGGWLENEFLKKTPSPKFGLESQLGTSDLEFVNREINKGCVKALVGVFLAIDRLILEFHHKLLINKDGYSIIRPRQTD